MEFSGNIPLYIGRYRMFLSQIVFSTGNNSNFRDLNNITLLQVARCSSALLQAEALN